jgi:hypothetical protein
VPVVFLIAIAVVLVGIFFAATGRGGELAYEHADHAPLDLGPVSAADIALLRPPTAMWGYNMQVTDAALDQIAKAMRERDVTIAHLQEQVATYERNGSYSESRGAHARQAPGALDYPGFLETSGPPTIPDPMEPPTDPGALEPPDTLDTLEPQEAAEPPDALEPQNAPGPSDALEPQIAPGPSDALESRDASEPQDTSEPQEPLQPQDAREPQDAQDAQDTPNPQDTSEPQDALHSPEPAEPHQTLETHEQPRTALVLKASGPKPERQAPTQPSPVLPGPGDEHDATQPSATAAPDDAPGPQGAFDTHGWWAEQQEAARQEQARRRAAGEPDDESVAAAEEQGW